jgi:hypothetical protein
MYLEAMFAYLNEDDLAEPSVFKYDTEAEK